VGSGPSGCWPVRAVTLLNGLPTCGARSDRNKFVDGWGCWLRAGLIWRLRQNSVRHILILRRARFIIINEIIILLGLLFL
jgi:hypothetical protein